MKENQFIWLRSDREQGIQFQLVNIDHVVSVELNEAGSTRLRLCNGTAINVTGSGGLDLLKLFCRHSVLTNGEPATEAARLLSAALDESTDIPNLPDVQRD